MEREDKAQGSCCCCSWCCCSLVWHNRCLAAPARRDYREENWLQRKTDFAWLQGNTVQGFCKTILITAVSYILLWQRILGTSSPAACRLMWQGWMFAHWKCQQTRNVWLLILFSFLHIHVFFIPLGWSHVTSLATGKRHVGGDDVLAKFQFKLYAKGHFHNTSCHFTTSMLGSVNVSIVKIPL